MEEGGELNWKTQVALRREVQEAGEGNTTVQRETEMDIEERSKNHTYGNGMSQ